MRPKLRATSPVQDLEDVLVADDRGAGQAAGLVVEPRHPKEGLERGYWRREEQISAVSG